MQDTFPILEIQETQSRELTVTEVSKLIKRTVEDFFSDIRVRGEVSGLKIVASGHVYFSLKDNESVLRTVCWKGVFNSLNVKIEEGLEIICSGKISTYPGSSMYQLIVSKIEIAGEGALLALLEKRKKALEAEGLFDKSRKKPIPFLPLTIGVITSPTGAVIKDILHRISERFPLHVLVWPTLVQGEGAADQVAKAILGFNNIDTKTIPKPDVIIVARGGGSIEDLWAFNEEIVVRAVASSHIPLISAIGHETDTTLIDYVSDLRAPTPTAAAEKAVPVREDLQNNINDIEMRLRSVLPNIISMNENLFLAASKALKLDHYIASKTLKLEQAYTALERRMEALLRSRTERFYKSSQHLNINLVSKDISNLETKLYSVYERSVSAVNIFIDRVSSKLEHKGQLLESYHYSGVLKRGFTIVKSSSGDVITRKNEIGSRSVLDVEFFDGIQKVFVGSSVRKPKVERNSNNTQVSMFSDE